MPRTGRIDYPGAYHHVISRGIGRSEIFRDDRDRGEFVRRLARVLEENEARCSAWTLIPNHFHLLLRVAGVPLGRMMQALLTGYAMYFNRRWERSGYLFQNRFKSILCERDSYPWTGHAALMGNAAASCWQVPEEVLGLFAKDVVTARSKYRRFLEDGLAAGGVAGPMSEDDVSALTRNRIGLWEPSAAARLSGSHRGEEKILGSAPFETRVLLAANERASAEFLNPRSRIQPSRRWTAEQVIARAGDLMGVPFEEMRSAIKRPNHVRARALACYWLQRDLGRSASELAERLGISLASAHRSIFRGGRLAREMGFRLEN